jgi:hypothetical protein
LGASVSSLSKAVMGLFLPQEVAER